MIQMIEVSKLIPHVKNPRKNVGNVSELAESIKHSGVLQNLTVVPYYSPVHKRVMEGIYTVIIGHRRLAAAKLAGLDKVPCAVVEMSDKDQLATMLSENMQRSDLTVVEQAEGIQLLLDLGESVSQVAERTGLSESTVRRRSKIATLDKVELKKAEERGGTMQDYLRLMEIEDETERNKALQAVGTKKFDSVVETAFGEQAWRRHRAELLQRLEGCEKVEQGSWSTHEYMRGYRKYSGNYDLPDDFTAERYVYADHGWEIQLWRKKEKVNEEIAEAERRGQIRRAAEAARDEDVAQANRAFYERRRNWLLKMSREDIRDSLHEVADLLLEYIGTYHNQVAKVGAKVAAMLEPDYAEGCENDVLQEWKFSEPERVMLYALWAANDSEKRMPMEQKWNGLNGYDLFYDADAKIHGVYDFLEQLGYDKTEEERDWLLGQHPCFMLPEEEDLQEDEDDDCES